jgi:drug/metabolite transporter (DMT)-like permease
VAIGLALLTTVLYGVSNFVGPRLAQRAPLYLVLVVGQAVACVTALTLALATRADAPDRTAVLAALAAGIGNGFGLVTLYRAASLGPLSIVIPIGAIGAIVPVGAGIASGDSAGALKLLGIALALTGVTVAARRPSASVEAEGHDTPRAVLWSVFSALWFGLFLAALKPASDGGVLWAVGLSRIAVVTIIVVVALLLHQSLRAPVRTLPQLAVPGVLLFAGTLSYGAATQEGDLSVVSVLGSLFPVVTVLLAVLIGGERLSRFQAGGVVAALAGVVLLSAR